MSDKVNDIFNQKSQKLNPIEIFQKWLDIAKENEINDPTACALASVDENGKPNVRMVLLKHHDDKGFVFYTNLKSAKGKELGNNPNAAMCFHWKSIRKQVRIVGKVEGVANTDANAYFESRHPHSRLGAWASEQSQPLDNRKTMIEKFEKYKEKFGEQDIPRPEHWSGFRLVPEKIEFWKDGEFRLHDRIQFTKENGKWKSILLYP